MYYNTSSTVMATTQGTHLIDVARSVVEDSEHRHKTIRRAVRARHIRISGADAVNRNSDSAREFGDACALSVS